MSVTKYSLTSGLTSGILKICIKDAAVLRSCYMPFLIHGGLFIPEVGHLTLHQRICLKLRLSALPESAEREFMVLATVVWVTPERAQGGRCSGVGVQFDNNSSDLCAYLNAVSGAQDFTPGKQAAETTSYSHTL